MHLLVSTPGRVYTYSQIYQLVWQEYPHGDIANIIYCMVHRLKRKLKKVDVNAEHIIISVKEVGYSLTAFGKTLTPILDELCKWGENYLLRK